MAEALACFAAGADLVGLPLRLAHHAPDLREDEAAALVQQVHARNPRLPFACITYEKDPDAAAALCRFVGASLLQLHGEIAPEAGRILRQLIPDVLLMKSLVVGSIGEESLLQSMHAHATWADAFLTDTFDPATGAMGATGRLHDWRVSKALVAASPKPVMLAGGLTADNVCQAIRAVGPAGVDAHTGLEDSRGRKDWAALRAFVAHARLAFALQKAADCSFPNLRPPAISGT